jgi:hypothetical protein
MRHTTQSPPRGPRAAPSLSSGSRAPGRTLVAASALALLLLGAPAAHAQSITSGVLAGVIRDGVGQPLGDVEVTLSNQYAGGTRTFQTARDGAFRFLLLPPGSYTIRAELLSYRPKIVQAVPVRPGEGVELEIQLASAPGAVDAPEVVRFAGSSAGSRAGMSQWLSSIALDRLPFERRELGDVAGLSTQSTDALEVEGLPSSLSILMLDGVRFAPVRHQDLDRGEPGIATFPISAFDGAELVTADPDMEWSGFAGGALAANTRRGSGELTSRAFASFSGGPLHGSKYIDGSSPSNASLWGGALISGPIIPDTAHFVVGLEARRVETPLPSPWASPDAAGSVVAAGTTQGVALEPYTRPFAVQSTVASGFGRFDWLIGSASTMSVRAGFGRIMPASGDLELGRATVPGAVAEGSDLMLSAGFTSVFRGDWAYELRVGVTRASREYQEQASVLGGRPILPSTYLSDGGLHFGADARIPGVFRRTGFTTAQSIEMSTGLHRVQLGIETDVALHDDSYASQRPGEFFFGGASDFAAGRGAFVQTLLPSPRGSYTRLGMGAYVQDTWNAGPGLNVLAGLRYDVETLPVEDTRLSLKWQSYTGLDNADIPARVQTISPRIGFSWDVGLQGLWTVRAAAGAYPMPISTDVITELLSMDGTPTVLRRLGNVDEWPGVPTGATLNLPARLTLLGSDFRSPYTGRASFGVSRYVSGGTTLHLSGAYRETEYLARRVDVNLQPLATSTDQHGRPIFGRLGQVGSLVAAQSVSRRFADFDMVSALNADGWSRYWGITGAIEHDAGGSLALFARYTYSRTTDNWLARSDGGPDAQLSPFAGGAADDWREGTSDYDLTHRLAAGAEIRLAGATGPRLAAVYRYRSGYPFTPGFPVGVDVNADGSGRNDPAFIDESVSGASAVVRSWNCLASQIGRFAERNSCREPGAHSLDLRFGLNVVRSEGLTAEIVAEGLNLIEPAIGEIDTALYRIDPTRTISEDTTRRVVTIPLIANPDFGEPRSRIGSGRTLRVGLQVSF